jgi:hypothetical protein
MLDAAIGPDDPVGVPSGDWRADLTALARQQRAVGRRHPWWVVAPARPVLGPNTLRRFDLALAALDQLPIDVSSKGWLITMIDRFVRGFLEEELVEEEHRRRTGMTEDQYRHAVTPYIRTIVDSGDYPHLNNFIADNDDIEPDTDFDTGLEALLDGLDRFVARRRTVSQSSR